ncbi:HAD family hydrolase [Uliginosibacterium gangwonense]|uniref:HAD family hydrolase n=1 Tax=Uliginosibacterium gangwonense TaxID=392736 RepID=UPI00037AE288|nr:HAD family hydrolase [Uliginosibacterium gangwonense]
MHGLLHGWNAQVRPIGGLRAMLEALQASYTLAVISNTHYAPLVHGNLARFGLSDCFRHVLTSVEHGQRKPSSALFHAMLLRLRAQTDECAYVGDNPLETTQALFPPV